jgi:hypothetical protein
MYLKYSSYHKEDSIYIKKENSINDVYGNNRCLIWEPYKTTNTLFGKNTKFLYC